jgi:hypothetical protein
MSCLSQYQPIELADDDVLDVMRSRVREREVLDILDSPQPGEDSCAAHDPAARKPTAVKAALALALELE